MWPLGHAAIAYFCYTLSTHTRFDGPPAHVPVAFLLIGSQFPDLVDKPLAWYLGVLPTGRTLAHSLLVLVPLCLAGYVLARRYGRPEYAVAFSIGALSHALVDSLPALWGGADPGHLLWPLIPQEGYESGAPTITGLLLDSLGDPYFLSEFVLAGVALWLWRRDGYPGLELLSTGVSRVRAVTSR